MTEKKLRIAMLGHKVMPSRQGGVEVVVGALSTRMAAMGHAVTCYNRREKHNGSGQGETIPKTYRGVTIKSVPTINRKGLAAMSASFFAALFCAFGPYDIVHFHAEGPCAMLWLPKLMGKRSIATIHGLDHQRAKWGRLAKWYIMKGEKEAAKRADEVIVLSEGVKQYFLDRYGRETLFIPNGVDLPEPKPESVIRERFGLSRDGYFLFIGRLVPEKGLQYLIDAFMRVQTDKRLVIVGDASDTADFKREIVNRGNRDGRILFTGFQRGETLQALYTNAYVYVLPSDVEGMPLTLLEAMSYGNCCLVSDIGECAGVVETHGITFKRGDTDDLKEKLQTLADQPDIVRQYKSTAADLIRSKYNWDDVTLKTLACYRHEVKL